MQSSLTLNLNIMNKMILIEVKEVYGNGLVYVVSEHCEAIQKLTGRKTLTGGDKQALTELGFEFKVVLKETIR